MKGFTDKPTEHMIDDVFEVKRYVDGLSEFVLECNTPMTIAIQGDWGSGKTSMMNMIKERLEGKAVTVWFNTWQFSQFNLGDELALSLISSLIDSFDVNHESAQNIKKSIATIKKVTRSVSSLVVDTVVGGKAAELVGKGFDMLDGNVETTDVTKVLSDLKRKYETCVNALLAEKDKKLLVVFVDDLDRLPPQKAVELLEVLKLFLDCENCVYVLAIDYAVVSQGVRYKYGNAEIENDKGKSFFDKIIQVPFKMPVAHYRVDKFVEDLLTQLGIKWDPDSKEKEIQTYINLIQASTGCNPRTMKRLFNVYLLLSKVATDNTLNDNWSKKILFAILCLQLSYENLYTYIVNNRQSLDVDFLVSLTKPENFKKKEGDKSLFEELDIKGDIELSQMTRFMTVLKEVIDKDENDELDEEEMENFVRILSFSTITSSNTSSEDTEDADRSHYRKLNRFIIKSVNEDLSKQHKDVTFNVYQARRDHSDDLRFHYAVGYFDIACLNGQIAFDYKIMTDLETKKSCLQLAVFPRPKTIPEEAFQMFIQTWPEVSEFIWDQVNGRFYKACPEICGDDPDEMRKYTLANTESIISSLINHCKTNG